MVYTLGQACIISKGAYSSSASYVPLNLVTHLGGAFLCKQACTGIEPGVTSGWASYWETAANGIKQYGLSVSGSTATVTITYTNGSTSTFTYSTAAVADNSIDTLQLKNEAVTMAKLATDARSVAYTETVAASAWSGGTTVNVTVSGLLSSDLTVISPAPASLPTWRDCGVYCSAQSNGSITLTCDITPSSAITVQVMVVR